MLFEYAHAWIQRKIPAQLSDVCLHLCNDLLVCHVLDDCGNALLPAQPEPFLLSLFFFTLFLRFFLHFSFLPSESAMK